MWQLWLFAGFWLKELVQPKVEIYRTSSLPGDMGSMRCAKPHTVRANPHTNHLNPVEAWNSCDDFSSVDIHISRKKRPAVYLNQLGIRRPCKACHQRILDFAKIGYIHANCLVIRVSFEIHSFVLCQRLIEQGFHRIL